MDAAERHGQDVDGAVGNGNLSPKDDGTRSERPRARSTGSRPRTRRKSTNKSSVGGGAEANPLRSKSRTRTVTVSDQGQTDGDLAALRREYQASPEDRTTDRACPITSPSSTNDSFLSPTYIPKSNKPLDHSTHFRDRNTDTASISTIGIGTLDNDSLCNASTTAIFSAPGVISAEKGLESIDRPTDDGEGADLTVPTPTQHNDRTYGSNPKRRTTESLSPPNTPLSTSSKERLWSSNHPQPQDGSSHADEGQHRDSWNPSMVAMVGGEG